MSKVRRSDRIVVQTIGSSLVDTGDCDDATGRGGKKGGKLSAD